MREIIVWINPDRIHPRITPKDAPSIVAINTHIMGENIDDNINIAFL
jgi:hypothetical protein